MRTLGSRTVYQIKRSCWKIIAEKKGGPGSGTSLMMVYPAQPLLGLDSDTFYIYHVTAVMVDNLRRLLLGINLSDKAVMDFDFPGVGFPV